MFSFRSSATPSPPPSLLPRSTRRCEGDVPSITGLGIRRRTLHTYRQLKKEVSRRRRRAKAAVIDLTAPLRGQVLLALKDVVKASLSGDPHMCSGLSAWIRHSVDDLWQDVEREVNLAVEDARHGLMEGRHAWKDIEMLRALGAPPARGSFLAFRAWVLYSVLPSDLSIFGSVRSMNYWLFFSLSMIPAVRIFYYAMTLCLINCPGPPDEYQLVQYILQIKATQFLSSGIGLAFVGGLQYFMCVHKGFHTCDTSGPGASRHPIEGAIDVLGNCALIWASFLVLPYSKPAAGLRQSHDEALEAEDEGVGEDPDMSCCFGWRQDPSRGGRLSGLLWYDLVCFLASGNLLICMLIWHYYNEGFSDGIMAHIFSWEFKATLYWARVFYSLLAFPFLVFNVPVLSSVLTHTVPTGYNRNGVAVAWMLPPMEDDALVPLANVGTTELGAPEGSHVDASASVPDASVSVLC